MDKLLQRRVDRLGNAISTLTSDPQYETDDSVEVWLAFWSLYRLLGKYLPNKARNGRLALIAATLVPQKIITWLALVVAQPAAGDARR